MEQIIKDKIKGVIFGQAIGDALGLGMEFLSKQQVLAYYPNGYDHYSQIIQDKHRSRWQKGCWTDDTDQFICILDSLIENKTVNELDIAKKIKNWFHTNGMGIGATTYKVLTLPQYELFPKKGAELIWKMKNKNAAPNGGLMRNGIMGTFKYWDSCVVARNSRSVCELTHFDPRCKDSCEIMSLIIANELNFKPLSWNHLKNKLKNYDHRIISYIISPNDCVENLKLDDSENIGYTLKALNAGIWAYYNSNTFKNGLLKIIMEGGDADTNGSIAGSILGAKFGYSKIPKKWIEGLKEKEKLEIKAEKYLTLLDELTPNIM